MKEIIALSMRFLSMSLKGMFVLYLKVVDDSHDGFGMLYLPRMRLKTLLAEDVFPSSISFSPIRIPARLSRRSVEISS